MPICAYANSVGHTALQIDLWSAFASTATHVNLDQVIRNFEDLWVCHMVHILHACPAWVQLVNWMDQHPKNKDHENTSHHLQVHLVSNGTEARTAASHDLSPVDRPFYITTPEDSH